MGDAPPRVLVVDDEEVIRVLLAHALTSYAVTVASTVAEARKQLVISPFEAVLTDKNLPDGDGADVCRETRRSNPDAVVIVLTGYASTRSAEEFLRLDVDDYIAKPFDIEAVKQRLRSALERRRETSAARAVSPKPSAAVGRRIFLSEPDDQACAALARVLEGLGCTVVVGRDALEGLRAGGFMGAVLNRRLCTEEVKGEVLKQKVTLPTFRLVVTIDNRALGETVASILVGAVGQVARPVNDEAARAVLAPLFGNES
jgi:CheY-like chemotaxis protein